MRKFLTAAVIALGLVAVDAPARAAAINCTQLTTGLRLCIPKYGTDFADWARADIAAFSAINSSAAINSTSAVTTADWLMIHRLSGLATGTAGIQISSYTWFTSSVTVTGGGGMAVNYGVFVGSMAVGGAAAAGYDLTVNNTAPNAVRIIADGGYEINFSGAAGANIYHSESGQPLFIGTNGGNVNIGVSDGGTSLVLEGATGAASFSGSVTAVSSMTSLGAIGAYGQFQLRTNGGSIAWEDGAGNMRAIIGFGSLLDINGYIAYNTRIGDAGGNTSIGTTASFPTKLNVEGNAQFGSGATKSTFTATGGLSVPSEFTLGTSSGVRIDNHGHAYYRGTTPTVTSCGTSPSIAGKDAAGKVTTGSPGSTTCTINFASAWDSAPHCVPTSNAVAGISGQAVGVQSVSTTQLVLAFETTFGSVDVRWVCFGTE